MKILYIILVILVFAMVIYYLVKPESSDPGKTEKKIERLNQRKELNDSLVIQDKHKTDTLIKIQHEIHVQYIENKPNYRILDADSSISLLSESLREYNASKDSF